MAGGRPNADALRDDRRRHRAPQRRCPRVLAAFVPGRVPVPPEMSRRHRDRARDHADLATHELLNPHDHGNSAAYYLLYFQEKRNPERSRRTPAPGPARRRPGGVGRGRRDRFLTGGRAWAAYRSGAGDPAAFGLTLTNEAGDWWIAANLMRDAAALRNTEVLPWDCWGAMPGPEDTITAELALLFDRLAALAENPDASHAELDWLCLDDERLRVPRAVRSAARGRDELLYPAAQAELRRRRRARPLPRTPPPARTTDRPPRNRMTATPSHQNPVRNL